MAVAAAFVVTASIIAERSGAGDRRADRDACRFRPGPSYVFLALDHDAAFIAESALASFPINAVTMFFCLTYVLLAQRQNAAGQRRRRDRGVDRTRRAGAPGAVDASGGLDRECHRLRDLHPAVHSAFSMSKMPLITRRWYDIPLRATMVATLVRIVVSLSRWVGPFVSGTIALFPVVLTSMTLILHPRIGGPATAAVIANGGWGMMGFGIAIAVLNLTAIPLGSAAALSLALATCVVWNLMLWWLGRRKIGASAR